MNLNLNREKLTLNEIRAISFYLIISLILLLISNFYFDTSVIKFSIFFYSFITQFILFTFGYKSLRKLNFYLISILIGIIHLAIYLAIFDNEKLNFQNNIGIKGLRVTFFAILIYYLLRIISLNFQKKDLDCPTSSGIELLGFSKTSFVDSFLYIIFYLMLLIGMII